MAFIFLDYFFTLLKADIFSSGIHSFIGIFADNFALLR